MIRVYHRHLKSPNLKYCNPGARAWFHRQGLDWAEFVRDGLPEEAFLNTGDAMAIAVVEEARKEWAAKAERPQ
jgi:hypothetical protein